MSAATHPAAELSALPPHKAALLQACLDAKCLSFGTFTLKSGRISPYFFNAGALHTGPLLTTLSHAFAVAIATYEPTQQPTSSAPSTPAQPAGFDFDVLFGPAYKGIPLATATSVALHALSASTPDLPRTYDHVSYAFNRKAAKTYGDGGSIVGAPLAGKRVLIIDDVITAGTAIREAVGIIEREGGTVVGVVVALDRQEKSPGGEEGGRGLSAIGEVRRALGVGVVSVLSLDDIIVGYKGLGSEEDIRRLEAYREEYSAAG